MSYSRGSGIALASIADILMAQGRHAAESKRARAGQWQPLIQHLANLPNQVMADRAGERAAQEAAFDRGQQRDVRGQQLAKGQQELETGERAAARDEALKAIFSAPGSLDEAGTTNWGGLLSNAKKLAPELIPELEKAKYQHDDGVAKAAHAAATEARAQQEFDNKQTDRRQATNQQGVRRMIGEDLAARGGQPLTPAEGQTYQGMALQEGIELPKGVLPEPEEEVSMVVRGPNGRPTRVMVPKSQLRQGGVEEYLEPRAAGSTDTGPLETIIGPDGKPIRVARRDALGKTPASGTSKPATGLEKRALNFFNRAEQADKDLEALETEVMGLGLAGQARMQWAPNVAQTETGQLYTQAQRAFTEARLRKDSGAAIPEQEFKNDRQTYFAQPGDSKTTLEQKRRARAAVLASLGFESGQALGEFVGDLDEARGIVDRYKARAARPASGATDQPPPAGSKIGRFQVEVGP